MLTVLTVLTVLLYRCFAVSLCRCVAVSLCASVRFVIDRSYAKSTLLEIPSHNKMLMIVL